MSQHEASDDTCRYIYVHKYMIWLNTRLASVSSLSWVNYSVFRLPRKCVVDMFKHSSCNILGSLCLGPYSPNGMLLLVLFSTIEKQCSYKLWVTNVVSENISKITKITMCNFYGQIKFYLNCLNKFADLFLKGLRVVYKNQTHSLIACLSSYIYITL